LLCLTVTNKLKKECLCYWYEDTLLQVITRVTRITTILKLCSDPCGSKQTLEFKKESKAHIFSMCVCVCVYVCVCAFVYVCVGMSVILQILAHVCK